MIDIGHCIRRAQVDFDISSDELASRLDTHKQTIYRYRMSKDLKLSVIEKISNALEISVIDLLMYDR